ncbi:MAG: hypothetical protein JO261_11470 [Alphaproteobacteria bacterium]|nr:hypothetical protein [Alphaproteobacteria bacterium]
MSKMVRKPMSIMSVVSKDDVNVRLRNNYDLPSMVEQIRQGGGIHTPIIIERQGDEWVVLSGNRRTRAGQLLYKDPTLTAELKEKLDKVEFIVYSELTPAERLSIINDQGSQKELCKTEIVLAVRRAFLEGQSESDIITRMYYSLASFTGNTNKLRELPTEPKAREAKLKTWFHGTVGNGILAVATMGGYVWDQFVLTHKAADGLLEEGESVTMKVTRERIKQLSAARTSDRKPENGGWNPETGGKEFNKLIDQFKAEDAGTADKVDKKRPTPKELSTRADAFKCKGISNVLRYAAGEGEEFLRGLLEEDDRLFRIGKVLEVLSRNWDSIPESLRPFCKSLLDDSPEKFEEHLKSMPKS